MNTTYRLVTAIFSLLALSCATASATELGDSIDTYQYQTASTDIFVQGRTVLTSNNVTVTSTGHLTMTSPEGISITGSFEVQPGGRLELNGGRQYLVTYTYDAAGNRIRRKHE